MRMRAGTSSSMLVRGYLAALSPAGSLRPDSDVGIGCSRLAQSGWAIKAICADSLAARRVIKELREKLYAAQDKPMPWLGRF